MTRAMLLCLLSAYMLLPHRMHLFDKPSALPKLLNSVKWYLHKDVAVVSVGVGLGPV